MFTKPSLALRQQARLALTPQVRQSLSLLGCSADELVREVDRVLAENPLLLHDSGSGATASVHRWDWSSGVQMTGDIPEQAVPESLAGHLRQQLQVTRASAHDRELIACLIDNLDERGYVEFDVAALNAMLPHAQRADEGEWRVALRLLQSFDPVGVGARDLAECLRLQLRDRAGEWPADVLACALQLTAYLPEVAAGRWQVLQARLHCPRALLDAAHRALLRLDPRPLRQWQGDPVAYRVPDVSFSPHADGWHAALSSSATPSLRLDARLAAFAQRTDTGSQARTQLEEAQALLRALEQRGQTILRVAQAIARHQPEFLAHGPSALRPLTLGELAGELGLHESTLSRTVRLKYGQTTWGVFELRTCFTSGVRSRAGRGVSAQAVQALMVGLLARRPELSDAQLSQQLSEQGVVIARRTVTKYRRAMGLASAAGRRQMRHPQA